MVEATWKGDRTRLEQTLSQPDYAAYVSSMDSGWSALAKQFGPLESYDILGTGPYPFTEEYIRTYARLNFEREFVIVTFGYRRGGFFDLSTWENVPNPGALPFAPISENEFETYNLWTSRTSRVVFDISADGTVSGFQVLSSGRRLFAKKIR
jgi:hypothetical protein